MISDIELKPWITQTLISKGIKSLTPIQEKTLPLILKQQNVIGVSPTGSGKTFAFLLPILNSLELINQTQVVIIVPTRELARQIHGEIMAFKKQQPLLSDSLLIGGADYDKQIAQLQVKPPQILIATANRLLQALMAKQIDYRFWKTIVLDEVDMLMDLGFGQDLYNIFQWTSVKNLQKLAWSATLHQLLSTSLAKFFKNTKIINVGLSIYENKQITHHVIHTKDKTEALDIFVKQFTPYLCIIFCNTKQSIDGIVKHMQSLNLAVIPLHGDLSSRERQNINKEIKQLKYQYIVASDLASRGLDIDGVSHIINWELPKQSEWYIHRVGRCGRGKYNGEAYTFYDESQVNELTSLIHKGIDFQHYIIQRQTLVAKTYHVKIKRTVLDHEALVQIKKLRTQKQVVKPGYKKKQKAAIQKIKQKSRRRYLEAKIKQDRIKKYKQQNALKKSI